MDNRRVIEKTVKNQPGISFTKLKGLTGLENGVIQYHINRSDTIVRKKKALTTRKGCKQCSLKPLCRQECVKKLLRDETRQKLIRCLDNGLNQSEISVKTGLSPSTISYHISRLEDFKLVEDKRPQQKVLKNLPEI